MITGFPTTGLDATFDYLVWLVGPSRRKLDVSATHEYADFAEMRADYERRGTITINTAHSDATIYATPHINHCFRYWHDMTHLKVNSDFSPVGERLTAEEQTRFIWSLEGPDNRTKARWAAILDTEVNGQVDFYLRYGRFPSDQRAFAIARLFAKGYDAATFPHTLDGLTIAY